MELILSFLVGLILTSIVAFFIARSVLKSRVAKAEESAREHAEHVFSIEKKELSMKLEYAQADVDKLNRQIQLDKEEAQRVLNEKKIEWNELYKKDLEEQERAQKEAREELEKKMNLLVGNATKEINISAEKMLKERQNEFSQKSNESIEQIFNPIKKCVDDLQRAVNENKTDQANRDGRMEEQIKNLMEQCVKTQNTADEMTAALRHDSKVQGDWGEMKLENLLTSQGLVKGINFSVQSVLCDENGKPIKNDNQNMMRPDVILHLDQKREIIIDSKVSLTAFANYVNAEKDEDKERFLDEHIKSLEKHWKELANKDYSSYVVSPKVSAGAVIMYVPIRGAFIDALNRKPGLWYEAANKKVIIVDDQGLFLAIKTVSITWTQIAQNENHKKLYDLAQQIVDRVGAFKSSFDAIGRALNLANKEYNNAKNKLAPNGHSIITSSRNLMELGVKTKKDNPLNSIIDVDDIHQVSETSVTADIEIEDADVIDNDSDN